jgi:hypothetical protein
MALVVTHAHGHTKVADLAGHIAGCKCVLELLLAISDLQEGRCVTPAMAPEVGLCNENSKPSTDFL